MEPELTPTRLGDLLQRARSARGFSLQQVERDTRIRRRYLEALETDDLAALPAPVFTRGLVRSYAHYLGVSVTEASELLKKEEQRTEGFGLQPTVSAGRAPSIGGGGLRTTLALLSAGLLVGLAAYFAGPLVRALVAGGAGTAAMAAPATAPSATRAAPGAPVASVATATALPTPLPTATTRPTVAPTSTLVSSPTVRPEERGTATAAAALHGVTLEARITARVWIQGEVDGEIVYSGILMPGEKKTFRAERRVFLHVGNAGAVNLTLNGRSIGAMGAPGEIAKAEWTASG